MLFILFPIHEQEETQFVPANEEITDAAPAEMLVDEDEEDLDIIY